ncbi:MAG: DUF4837 family protein [Bacteroidales bacterium]|nr:DUF4837 family protein [Bacteroidales bacterium]MBR6227548.1 DUF4837 family protein [Bacteroidales bacterium]
MKSYLKIAAVILIAAVMTSCTQTRSGRMDRSVGGTSEILVVTQNDEQWKGRIGDSIRHFFLDYQYGLPQPESRNDLAHINAEGFSDLFQKHKNIIEVVIDPSKEKAVAETAEDMWAAPQRYVKITAPDLGSWVELFDKQKEVYKQWFDKVERERILNVFRPTKDEAIENAIAKKFGFTLTVPQGFYIAKDEPDFMWLRKEQERSSADIVIYQTPYRDTMQFETNSLIAMRNMMVGQYIPGPSEGSYMGTETEFVPPLVTQVKDFPAGFAEEMRGMWKVENDFMGGPFVSYTFVNADKLATVEGFYYEPNQKKRNMMLQLESIAYSLKFVEE